MRILVTGCAGFIGSNLVDKLLKEEYEVVGIDNFNDYYNPEVKEKNIESAVSDKNFMLHRMDVLDEEKLRKIFETEHPDKIVHLAARAGVRPSIAASELYTKVNVLGTVNMLKSAVDFNVSQFIFGSSSSVYGNSKKLPFYEDDTCENIISPYGASKRAAEFFVEVFAKNFGLKAIVLRFFTVYGQRGRPDMAPALFTNAILTDETINKFGDGTSSRDYTYIDDIVDGIVKTIENDFAYEIINLGNNHPISLNEFIKTLEKLLGKAKIKSTPTQTGDVEKTWANIEKAKELLGWAPKISLEQGLTSYIKWLRAEN